MPPAKKITAKQKVAAKHPVGGNHATAKKLQPAAGIHGHTKPTYNPTVSPLPKQFMVNNTAYATKLIPSEIYTKLKHNFSPKVTAFEIAPSRQEKITLITQLIGGFAIPYLINSARFYHINYIDNRVNSFMKYMIPDIGKSLGEIINTLLANNIKVFLHGGTIRDFFTGAKSTDIDVIFDTDVMAIKRLCNKESWPCETIIIPQQYINFGKEKGISLEGSNLKSSLLTPMHLHEVTINDFTLDFTHKILIDLTGHGLSDVLDRKIRISPLPAYWNRWADEDFKKPLRYFKLIQKGFSPINKETHDFIVNYINDNFDKVYEKQFSAKYPVSRIKHFLIKNITQGDIDPETGVYTFGPLQDKLIPYLQAIKKHVGKPAFVKMMAHFTEADLLLLKNNKVVSSIRNYLTKPEVRNAQLDTIEYKALEDTKTKKHKT